MDFSQTKGGDLAIVVGYLIAGLGFYLRLDGLVRKASLLPAPEVLAAIAERAWEPSPQGLLLEWR